MTPWWKHHERESKPCRRCKGTEDVHRGLCRHCREQMLAEETPGGPGRLPASNKQEAPHQPDVEPAHERPWVHRGGG